MQNGFDDFDATISAEEYYRSEGYTDPDMIGEFVRQDTELYDSRENALADINQVKMGSHAEKVLRDWVDRAATVEFGEAYAVGYLYSTLAHALDDLATHDKARADQILARFTLPPRTS